MREAAEELSAEVTDLRLLGVPEDLYRFDGGDGHEIVFVYDARFVDSSIYGQREVTGLEGEMAFAAHWIDPHAPANGWALYPTEVADLLRDATP